MSLHTSPPGPFFILSNVSFFINKVLEWAQTAFELIQKSSDEDLINGKDLKDLFRSNGVHVKSALEAIEHINE